MAEPNTRISKFRYNVLPRLVPLNTYVVMAFEMVRVLQIEEFIITFVTRYLMINSLMSYNLDKVVPDYIAINISMKEDFF